MDNKDETDITTNPFDLIMDAHEAAERWGVSEVTVKRWCREGHVPCRFVGNAYAIIKDCPKPDLPPAFGRKGKRKETT